MKKSSKVILLVFLVLFVDQFVKIWIKTQPLKQWEVAREYRRRLKLAMDEAKITLPVSQRTLWFTNTANPDEIEDPNNHKQLIDHAASSLRNHS